MNAAETDVAFATVVLKVIFDGLADKLFCLQWFIITDNNATRKLMLNAFKWKKLC